MTSADQLESMAQYLEASGDYRVVRRLKPRLGNIPPPGVPTWYGLVVDVETTGLDARKDEIIELAMTPFTYGRDGTIYMIGGSFSALRQPSVPISPAITGITGITNEMLAGIQSLPTQYRVVIIMRDMEERTVGEIAQALSLSREAVKGRLHRARSLLREYLT